MIFQILLNLYTIFAKKNFCHFGKKSIIKPFLNTANASKIYVGDNVDIGSFCRITVSTQFAGIKCKSKNKIIIKIGNNVDVGNNTFISGNNDIQIGDHVIMAPYVFITDHEHQTDNIDKDLHHQSLTNNGYVHIEDNVFIGTKASILKNVTIGRHSTIGANSVVTKDIPPFSIVVGNPAKIIKQYDIKLKKWIKK